jgi:hypothetical protein
MELSPLQPRNLYRGERRFLRLPIFIWKSRLLPSLSDGVFIRRLAKGIVMSDAPIQRDPPKLDRVAAAHERRARLIAQLLEQSIATANDLSAEQEAMRAGLAKDAQRRKAEAWLFSAEDFLIALGCVVAAGCMLAVWL